MIGSHAKNLPSAIIKMLVECLVFSCYTYALPVWGTAIHKNSRLTRLYNGGIQLSCGLHKYDHVTQHKARLGWLPVDSFVKYRSLFDYYTGGVLFSILPFSLVVLTFMRLDALLILLIPFISLVRNTLHLSGGTPSLFICFRT